MDKTDSARSVLRLIKQRGLNFKGACYATRIFPRGTNYFEIDVLIFCEANLTNI